MVTADNRWERWGVPYDAIEIVEKRTRNSKTFRKTDGTYLQVFSNVLHYQNSVDSPWNDIVLEYRQAEDDPNEYIADQFDMTVRVRKNTPRLEITDKNGNGIVWYTTSVMELIDKNHVQFKGHNLYWKYGLTKSGVKLLSGPVTAPRGPYAYRWRYDVIGNAEALLGTSDGGLTNGIITIKHAVVIGANGEVYECEPWWVEPNGWIHFAFDDTVLPPEAYPYEIDPSTEFAITVGANDGYIHCTGTSWPPNGTPSVNTTLNMLQDYCGFWNNTYYYYNKFVRFDTSSIPSDAVITGATLQTASESSIANKDNRLKNIEWFNWDVLSSNMWTASVGASAASFVPTAVSFGTVVTSTLNNADVYINKTGYTGLRAGWDVSMTTPTGDHRSYWASFEHTTYQEPRLIVTYTVPGEKYFTDFSDTNIGQQPSGWTNLYPSNGTFLKTSGGYVALNGWGRATWSDIGRVNDVEIYIHTAKIASPNSSYVLLKYDDTKTDYFWGVEFSSGSTLKLIRLTNDGSIYVLSSYTYSIAVGEQIHIRIGSIGSTLRAKVWANGTMEPTDWQVQATVASPFATRDGFVGVGYPGSTGYYMPVYKFGVGTNGASAPTEPVASQPEPPIVTINSYESRISDEPGMENSTIKFIFDKEIDMLTVRRDGTSHDTGVEITTYDFINNPQPAGTEFTLNVNWAQLIEGQNRINIYGRSLDGSWTAYEW